VILGPNVNATIPDLFRSGFDPEPTIFAFDHRIAVIERKKLLHRRTRYRDVFGKSLLVGDD
jgi:hypothetical protein